MMELMRHTDPKVIAIRASGTLTKADYDKLLPILRDAVEQYDKISWYMEMDDFSGWDARAFWKDLQFGVEHANNFYKIAMVGEETWEDWFTQLMKPFTSAEVRYFELEDRDQAWRWVGTGAASERS